MSDPAPDLIAGYLADLCAGLRVPVAEAELILAEAEDHLRETAAAGQATGMTEREAQQSAISSFGPARTVVRAHHRRAVTIRDMALAAWKLAALLTMTVGAGGLAGLGVFTYSLRSAPGGMWGVLAPPGLDAVAIYAAMAAGGLVLLAVRRLARRGAPGRDPLSPWIKVSCFLLASGAFAYMQHTAPTGPPAPTGPVSCPFSCYYSGGPPPPDLRPALAMLAVYAAMAAGGLVLLAVRWLARRGAPGRDPLFPWVTASCLLLTSALLLGLTVWGVAYLIAQLGLTWLTPVGQGTVAAAPLVWGAVTAGCLTMAAGYGAQAVLRQARLRPALRRVLVQAGRGGADRAYA